MSGAAMQPVDRSREAARVTFLTTTFNAGEFLRPAIESVLAQTDRRWRLIIVDDGSTDDSAEVAASYRDPRVTTVRLERNVGQTAALNLGLEMVETDWVARLDQDDLAAPDRLKHQLAFLQDNPGTVLVGSWADYIDERGSPAGSWRPATESEEVRRALYTRPCPFAHSAVMYRADVARSVGGYPTELVYAQDLALWIRMDAVGTIANVPRVLTYLRLHSNQASRDPVALELQIAETLSLTQTLPAALAHDRRTVRAWRTRRLASMGERVVAAVRSGNWSLARRNAAATLKALIADPVAVFRIAGLGACNAYRKARERAKRIPASNLL
jgi:glycosyltransferase involved in cell wall biosynthesis